MRERAPLPDVVFLFPGQSSRSAAMFDALTDDPVCAPVLEEASDLLGRDVVALARDALARPVPRNFAVQVSVFVANHAHLMRLCAAGVSCKTSLGLSLGEYNHLVEIGALAFGDALRLVAARGNLFETAPNGMMASLFPTTRAELLPILEEASREGVVAISNENSPSQFVISGERAAVRRAITLYERDAFGTAVVIEERVPMHAPPMAPLVPKMAADLQNAPWRPAAVYRPNLSGRTVDRPAAADFVATLSQHVARPVLWRQSIDEVLKTLPEATFVEVGPGRVLTNLMRKSWIRNPRFATGKDAPAIIAAAKGRAMA